MLAQYVDRHHVLNKGAKFVASTPMAEHHAVGNLGWLRAAVLGANDGLLSTSSLIIGVASAHSSRESVIVAGLSGLVAGAMSMAAGEFVSVSSQADSEGADLAREGRELQANPEGETAELAAIYVKRGLDEALARQVAIQLMAKDALSAHARDELGISDEMAARPVQAAIASAISFAAGALPSLLTAILVPGRFVPEAVGGLSIIFLAILGALGAKTGGANIFKGAVRVTFWGAVAMAVTAGIGTLFGTHV
jgi:VIT1/CCC1 family predicted Fe2+/Mn2+ transporter